jgi:hypothetical protein
MVKEHLQRTKTDEKLRFIPGSRHTREIHYRSDQEALGQRSDVSGCAQSPARWDPDVVAIRAVGIQCPASTMVLQVSGSPNIGHRSRLISIVSQGNTFHRTSRLYRFVARGTTVLTEPEKQPSI